MNFGASLDPPLFGPSRLYIFEKCSTPRLNGNRDYYLTPLNFGPTLILVRGGQKLKATNII